MSEASCTSQIRTARAVTEEIGEGMARQSGVLSWSQIPFEHSERDVHQVISKQGSALDIPVSEMRVQGQPVPWIPPKDWFQFILRQGVWHHLAGVRADEMHLAGTLWETFWSYYQELNPHFELFSKPGVDYSRTVACYLHGDEGRTLKKSGLMVTSIQSALGYGFSPKRQKRSADGLPEPLVNYAGHTFCSRLVSFVIPKTLYESNNAVFHDAMEILAKELREIYDHGVVNPFTGERFWVAIIGLKGDLPYLAKAGGLNRAFNTATKRTAKDPSRRKKPSGICHLCLAGTDGFPAEEIATRSPAWIRTQGVKLPWDTTPVLLKHLPHDASDLASFFQIDLWHTVHLGFGRSYVASTVQLALECVPCSNLEEKWKWLTCHCHTWCRREKKQRHVSKISPTLMSYNDKAGAMGAWHKGALTTNFFKWLPCLIDALPPDAAGRLVRAKRGVEKLNAMFTMLYGSPSFLTREESFYVADCGFVFLDSYARLARSAYDAGMPLLYPLYPKLHYMHHILLEIEASAREHNMAFNVMTCGCQQDEDLVGRISRLSRRVSIRTVMTRTLSRYLAAALIEWREAGLLR